MEDKEKHLDEKVEGGGIEKKGREKKGKGKRGE